MNLPSSRRIPAALLAAVVSVSLSFAAPLAARADDPDSAVGVARIDFIDGSVAVQRGDSPDPVTAVVNAPVLGGDYVTTGDGTRAEIEFDGDAAIRLGENVQLRFTHLESGARALQLAEGTIDLRVMRMHDGHSDIDTPSVSVRPREPGNYRVSVDDDGQTIVTVRSGAADIVTPQGERELAPGTTLFASGAASQPSISTGDALALDDFDRFNGERDAREQRATAEAPYVDTNIQGVDDLAQYGHWVDDSSYGNVWVPNDVAPDWAPYRQGRWVWEDYYGWTWVGAEPWGWAPYHYGSWYHSAAYGWAWYPPRPAYAAPVWRPALVAFVSFGGGGVGLGLGFGGGGIGWVPLAPFEPYHPWWGRGYTSVANVTNVNVTNNYYGNGDVARRYKNAQFGGVTAVGAARFTQGRFDHPVALSAAQLNGVSLVRGPVPVVPTQANLRFSPSAAPARVALRSTLLEKRFAGNATAPSRIPFEQQRSAYANVTHLPATPAGRVDPATVNGLRAPGTRATGGSPGAASPWDRFTPRSATPVDRPLARPQTIDGTAPVRPRYAAPDTNRPTTTNPGRPAGETWSRYGQARGNASPVQGRGYSGTAPERARAEHADAAARQRHAAEQKRDRQAHPAHDSRSN